MATEIPAPIPATAARTWELTLDAELTPDAAPATAECAQAVADLLGRVLGVTAAVVRPHCRGRFLLAVLCIEAHDLAGAIDGAVAVLRSSATAAGAGPLVLVGARCSGSDQARRRPFVRGPVGLPALVPDRGLEDIEVMSHARSGPRSRPGTGVQEEAS
jgi:hypothetical protein